MTTQTKSLLDGLVPQKQVLVELNCSRNYLRKLRHQENGLAAVKIGHHLYYRRDELEALVNEKLAAAKTNPARQ